MQKTFVHVFVLLLSHTVRTRQKSVSKVMKYIFLTKAVFSGRFSVSTIKLMAIGGAFQHMPEDFEK